MLSAKWRPFCLGLNVLIKADCAVEQLTTACGVRKQRVKWSVLQGNGLSPTQHQVMTKPQNTLFFIEPLGISFINIDSHQKKIIFFVSDLSSAIICHNENAMTQKRFPHYWPEIQSYIFFYAVNLNRPFNKQELPVIWDAMAILWCHCSYVGAQSLGTFPCGHTPLYLVQCPPYI